MVTAILVYISAKAADRVGRKPFVIATFVCFALFPVRGRVVHSLHRPDCERPSRLTGAAAGRP